MSSYTERMFSTGWARTTPKLYTNHDVLDPAVHGEHPSYRDDLTEPPYAIAEAFAPPHPFALSPEECAQVVDVLAAIDPAAQNNGADLYPDDALPTDLTRQILARIETANAYWWGLDIDRWTFRGKHYRFGQLMGWHTDLHARAATRKIAATIQLSDPDAYDGGNLRIRGLATRYTMPRAQGTLIVMPGWTRHEVTQVTRGERWSLCVNGWGPRLR